jgi:hypothetical protein
MKNFKFIKPNEELSWETYVDVSDNLGTIDKTDISGELVNHSALFAYYNGILNNSKLEVDLLTSLMEKLEAEIRTRVYKEYKAENKSKPTDKYLEMSVLSDNLYQEQKDKLIRLEYKYNLLKGLVNSLEHRKDCLIQLSSNSRAEMKLYD